MSAFNPRLTPARPDLAAMSLRGLVDAPRFVEGTTTIIFDGAADLRRAPVPDALLDTEALHGEIFVEYERDDEGWSWGQLERDSYVGYIPSKALTRDLASPTHRVAVLRSFLYGGPSIKVPPMAALSLGSRVTIVDHKDQFAITDTALRKLAAGYRGHCIIADHLVPMNQTEHDFVAVAERFLGVPYYWGGKTSLGLDCSALVQLSLDAAGILAPRDSHVQESILGQALPIDREFSGLRRGDLIFWKGHVAIMRDEHMMIHASGHQMLVVSEPLRVAAQRIADKGAGPVTAIKRF